MSREYPDWISPGRAAEGKRIYSGTIALSKMKRLAKLLVEANGEASFVAAFKSNMDKQVILDLQVEAELPLVCQASLEVYNEQVRRHSELAVIDDENQQEDVPDSYEPVLTENGRLAIASVVEDELLLGLPQIPRKPGLDKVEYSTGGKIRKSVEPQKGTRKNPFAALQGLLKRDQ
jgi:uncharacterized protein